MNQIIEVKFKQDKSKSPFSTYSKFKSQDINSVEFHLAFDGIDLNENHKVTVHCKFKKSESLVTEVAEVVEGKAIFKFDTRYITQKEEVHCSVYVSKGEQSIDVRTFIFEVELSEIDKGSLRVAGVYDANYQKLIVDFQQQLFDYRDSLPQASELRAEIDVVLNQFGADSQAKLNQYDSDAQQALADWEQGADAIINVVEVNESVRADAETTRKTAETDRVSSETIRKTNETTRISNENARKSAEGNRQSTFETNEAGRQSEFEENEQGRESAESVRVANEAERISKDGERDSKIEAVVEDVEVSVTNLFPYNEFLVTRYSLSTSISLTLIKNHKYYTRRVYTPLKGVDNGVSGSVRLINPTAELIGGLASYPNQVGVVMDYSVETRTDDIYLYGTNTPDSEGNRESRYNDLIIIDLTEAFGVGNEPTAKQMDSLLEQFPNGWFEGTINVYNSKHVMAMFFKELTKLNNAITTLGGNV